MLYYWRYITQLPELLQRVADLEKVASLMNGWAGRIDRRMNALAELIEQQTKLINQHNADDLAYQGQVNARFAKLQSTIAGLSLSDQDKADLDQAASDLRAAVAAQPQLALPPDNPATQTMLTTPAEPSPITPAVLPPFPGVPTPTDTSSQPEASDMATGEPLAPAGETVPVTTDTPVDTTAPVTENPA